MVAEHGEGMERRSITILFRTRHTQSRTMITIITMMDDNMRRRHTCNVENGKEWSEWEWSNHILFIPHTDITSTQNTTWHYWPSATWNWHNYAYPHGLDRSLTKLIAAIRMRSLCVGWGRGVCEAPRTSHKGQFLSAEDRKRCQNVKYGFIYIKYNHIEMVQKSLEKLDMDSVVGVLSIWGAQTQFPAMEFPWCGATDANGDWS